ncbi:hypothetical protein H0H92_015621 [Tricholoma furcatifolium]|nr:hypothetical protein H0H92_015621 [Tricholoma furcatifolium]
MLAFTFLILTLSSIVIAAPSNEVLKRASCDLSHATVDIPSNQTVLNAATAPLSYVAVAIGVQNYTCSSSGTYTNVGAVAELFDISCLYSDAAAFDDLTSLAYNIWELVPPTVTPQSIINLLLSANTPGILGQHYYVTNPITGSGVSPKWDFTSQGATKGNSNAYVIGAKTGDLPAPTGSQDIDWVQLKAVEGELATIVYRTDTRGGQPPAASKSHAAHFARDLHAVERISFTAEDGSVGIGSPFGSQSTA